MIPRIRSSFFCVFLPQTVFSVLFNVFFFWAIRFYSSSLRLKIACFKAKGDDDVASNQTPSVSN